MNRRVLDALGSPAGEEDSEMSGSPKKKVEDERVDSNIICYMLCVCLLESDQLKDLLEAAQKLEALRTLIGNTFPAVYHALGRAHCKLYRFKLAVNDYKEGLASLNKAGEIQRYYVPGTTNVIIESTKEGLLEALIKLGDECMSWHPPDAVCCLPECTNSQQYAPTRDIYFSDPAFNGMTVVTCNNTANPCRLKYHQSCWKKMKEQLFQAKKIPDKEVLGHECFTPNCMRNKNESGVIMKVEVVGSDANVKALVEPTVDLVDRALRQSPARGAIKKQKKVKRLTEKTPRKTLSAIPPSLQSIPQPSASKEITFDDEEEVLGRTAKLAEFRKKNFGIPTDKEWRPDREWYGNEHMAATTQFMPDPDFSAEPVKIARIKTFAFSFLFEYISRNGPVRVKDVINKWEELKPLIDDHECILNNHPDIMEFLLQSLKIVMVGDYVCLPEILPEVYNLIKEDTTGCLRFLMENPFVAVENEAEILDYDFFKDLLNSCKSNDVLVGAPSNGDNVIGACDPSRIFDAKASSDFEISTAAGETKAEKTNGSHDANMSKEDISAAFINAMVEKNRSECKSPPLPRKVPSPVWDYFDIFESGSNKSEESDESDAECLAQKSDYEEIATDDCEPDRMCSIEPPRNDQAHRPETNSEPEDIEEKDLIAFEETHDEPVEEPNFWKSNNDRLASIDAIMDRDASPVEEPNLSESDNAFLASIGAIMDHDASPENPAMTINRNLSKRLVFDDEKETNSDPAESTEKSINASSVHVASERDILKDLKAEIVENGAASNVESVVAWNDAASAIPEQNKCTRRSVSSRYQMQRIQRQRKKLQKLWPRHRKVLRLLNRVASKRIVAEAKWNAERQQWEDESEKMSKIVQKCKHLESGFLRLTLSAESFKQDKKDSEHNLELLQNEKKQLLRSFEEQCVTWGEMLGNFTSYLNEKTEHFKLITAKHQKEKKGLLKRCLNYDFISKMTLINAQRNECRDALEVIAALKEAVEKTIGPQRELEEAAIPWLQALVQLKQISEKHQETFVKLIASFDSKEDFDDVKDFAFFPNDTATLPTTNTAQTVQRVFAIHHMHHVQMLQRMPQPNIPQPLMHRMIPPLLGHHQFQGQYPPNQPLYGPPLQFYPQQRMPQHGMQILPNTFNLPPPCQPRPNHTMPPPMPRQKIEPAVQQTVQPASGVQQTVQPASGVQQTVQPASGVQQSASEEHPEIVKIDRKSESDEVSTAQAQAATPSVVEQLVDGNGDQFENLKLKKAISKSENSIDKLMQQLRNAYIGVSESILLASMQDVRRNHSDSLSGMRIMDIMEEMKPFILRRQIEELCEYEISNLLETSETTSPAGATHNRQRQQSNSSTSSASSVKKGSNIANGGKPMTLNERIQMADETQATMDNASKKKPVWDPVTNQLQPWTKKDDESECTICIEPIRKRFPTTVYTLWCQHTFHTTCIKKWFQHSHSCPTCRVHCTLDEEFPPLP